MMTLAELTEHFAIPGQLAFDEHDGLPRAQVTLASAAATIYLHGAHLTHWQPTGADPVIFLSAQSDFAPGKAIRGGIPICFPWFGPRSDGGPGPSHGFARLQEWELSFAALIPGETGERLHLIFSLWPTDLSRSLGFDKFRAAYEVTIGDTLSLRLTVANAGDKPLRFEEALHSYFAVGDVRQTTLTGLESALYRDKTDAMQEKHAPAGPLGFTAETDSVFPANIAPVTIHDSAGKRTIQVEKTNSATTVVWNPWATLAAKLADLPDDAWPEFVCVEAANTATDSITLQPGETHAMQILIAVAKA
jgi:glucose-6-phosphate 1-epimerase